MKSFVNNFVYKGEQLKESDFLSAESAPAILVLTAAPVSAILKFLISPIRIAITAFPF